MKTCTQCNQCLPLDKFGKIGNRHEAACKECKHKRQKRWYEENKKHKIAKSKARTIQHRNEVRAFLEQKRQEAGKCLLCPETCSACFDFHHISEKEFEVGKGLDYSLERIEAELKKCVVVCANCHRKIHAGIIEPTLV